MRVRTGASDRAPRGGLASDRRAPYAAELRSRETHENEHGAGGIRTHGLELMRLARTATPLPRGGSCDAQLFGRAVYRPRLRTGE